MQSGKCPKCEQIIGTPHLEHGPIGNQASGPLVAGFTAVCPRREDTIATSPSALRGFGFSAVRFRHGLACHGQDARTDDVC